MKRYVCMCGIVILMTLCGSIISGQEREVKSRVVAKVLAFGDKDLDSEYLLANPSCFGVDKSGNIYVMDEYKIKVFTNEGREKRILGRRGQGPGEFDNTTAHYLTVGPTGYIAAYNVNWYNIFNPDYSFAHTIRIERTTFDIMKALSGGRSGVFSGATKPPFKGVRNIGHQWSAGPQIVMLQEDEYIEQADNDDWITELRHVKGGDREKILTFDDKGQYSLFWSVTGPERLIYTRQGEDQEKRGDRYYYTISDYTLPSKNKKEYTFQGIPVEIPIRTVAARRFSAENPGFASITSNARMSREEARTLLREKNKEAEKQIDKLAQQLEKEGVREFYPAVNGMVLDVSRGALFVYSYKADEVTKHVTDASMNKEYAITDHDRQEYTADVIDISTWKKINTVEMFCFPVIMDGKGYRIIKNQDDFYVMEVYTIDPSVYTR